MNPVWLIKNILHGRRICASWGDAAAYVRLVYRRRYAADALPRTIRFRHPEAIGDVDLALRYSGDNFIRSEVFDHRYYDVDLGFEPKRILDLGGHIGLSSIFFERKFPSAEIVCVEPEPGNAEILRRNFALNRIKTHFLHAAVTVDDGQVMLQRLDQDFAHKIVDQADSGLIVRGLSVSSIMRHVGWDAIDLVKMDIEGHEAALLTRNAAWLHKVRALTMEVHPPFTVDKLREAVAQYGFANVQELPGCVLVTR